MRMDSNSRQLSTQKLVEMRTKIILKLDDIQCKMGHVIMFYSCQVIKWKYPFKR